MQNLPEHTNPSGLPRVTKIIFLSLAGLFLLANMAVQSAYAGRAFQGVKVAGVDIAWQDRQQALSVVESRLSGYKVDITVGSHQYQATPSQLGIDYDVETTLDEAFTVGHDNTIPLLGFLQKRALFDNQLAYQVDQDKFNFFVGQIVDANSTAPVDATVAIQNAQPTVVPDKNGTGVEQSVLATDLRHAVADQSASIVVPLQPIKADIQAGDVTPTIDSTKSIIDSHLELHYQNQVFVPTPVQISGWITFVKSADGKSWQPAIDTNKLKGYYLGPVVAKAINVAAVPERITAVNGQVKSDQPGSNGLAVDQDTLASQIAQQLPTNHDLSLNVPTGPVAFTKVYNNTIELGLAKYVEINLSTQHLWAWDNGQVVFDSPVTSGATGAGFATVTGLFSVQAKQTNRYLDGRPLGYNYDVWVQYWMPFYGNYGLHDASWRSSFGGPDYYYGGSHGCVNLPLATAAWLFNWVDVGTPVWVHN